MSLEFNETAHGERCFDSPTTSQGIFHNGSLVFGPRTIGIAISGVFTFLATVLSGVLVWRHLNNYTCKFEQRYIVRLLFMVPIYAIVSLLSFMLWDNATPLLLLRDAYEAIVLTAFFYLLLAYISHTPAALKSTLASIDLGPGSDFKWMFPLGRLKYRPRDGLMFLQICKWGVLQYCFIRPTTTAIALILNWVGLYCEGSWNPGWGYIWIISIISISVSVAMYLLIQFYASLSSNLKPHNVVMKLILVKGVVFLTFWQASILAVFASLGIVKDTKTTTADDINIGIAALAECVEMTIFAILHFKAFPVSPYLPSPSQDPTLPDTYLPKPSPWKALLHALSPHDILREMGRSMRYVVRGEDKVGVNVRRVGVWQGVFGEEAAGWKRKEKEKGKELEGVKVTSWYIQRVEGGNEKEKAPAFTEDDRVWSTAEDGDEENEEIGEGSRLTKENLKAHETTYLPASSPLLQKKKGYRPVSSLMAPSPHPHPHPPAHEYDSDSSVDELGAGHMTLEDHPPDSVLKTYKDIRRKELRRMEGEEAKEEKVKRKAGQHRWPKRQSVLLAVPHSPSNAFASSPHSREPTTLSITPTIGHLATAASAPPSNLSHPSPCPPSTDPAPTPPAKHLHPPVSYHAATVSSTSTNGHEADIFYDFDEIYEHDPWK